jgi:hypothetical protein
MEINKENYEIFILDYYEGRLNQSEELALFAFLDANSEIKAEFESFENISFADTEAISFDLKESLKKTDASAPAIINLTNYNSFFIAAIEGDLTAAQQKQLDIFLLQHPDLNEEFHLFQLTKLTADKNIVFENKPQLKKFIIFNTAINKKLIYQSFAIAASFLILMSVSLYFFNQKNITKQRIDTIQEISNTLIKKNKTTPDAVNVLADSKINHSNPINHQTIKESSVSPPNNAQQTVLMQELASIPPNRLAEVHSVNIINESRNENSNLCRLLVLAEEPAFAENNFTSVSKETEKDSPRFQIDESIYKENALAQLGGFIRYYAVSSISGAEKLGSFASNTYQAVENKLGGK